MGKEYGRQYGRGGEGMVQGKARAWRGGCERRGTGQGVVGGVGGVWVGACRGGSINAVNGA